MILQSQWDDFRLRKLLVGGGAKRLKQRHMDKCYRSINIEILTLYIRISFVNSTQNYSINNEILYQYLIKRKKVP